VRDTSSHPQRRNRPENPQPKELYLYVEHDAYPSWLPMLETSQTLLSKTLTSRVYGKRSDRCAIPREVKEALGLEGGDLILWEITGSRGIRLYKAVIRKKEII